MESAATLAIRGLADNVGGHHQAAGQVWRAAIAVARLRASTGCGDGLSSKRVTAKKWSTAMERTMTDQWMIKGAEYTNCNCDWGCPCQFGSPTTHGRCEAVATSRIDEGHFNDINLDGLSFVLALWWPGEIAAGNGRQQVILDESGTTEQREALRKIAHGESTAPGVTHYFVFNSTMSEVLEPIVAPIDIAIDVDAREAHIKVPDLVESKGVPIINAFSGEPARSGIHLPQGFEYTYAEMGNGTSTVRMGIELDLADSYGQFNVLHMNQDGVIR